MLPKQQAIVEALRAQWPDLLAVYAFGSQVQGNAGADSDLDLAVFVPGYAEPTRLFALAGDLVSLAGCEVDLLDFRTASTVMQYQVITTGERWWAADAQASIYEAAILSERTELERARAGLLSDIAQRGTVYGR